ncbi:hypothetical protein SBOR_7873 [Sclerotinia borealis F-4128]|uniref:Uncharacterized protein n=1 Tax=Sclerotinia borealis (strain F-4128) TaxID=1432307 RepID=W9C7D4_SCLBF|nr:hypothetical protein SBOR_7873 [Sclerotinia borealis F-4128]
MQYNDKNLIEAIKILRSHKPEIASNEIWESLVIRWPVRLDEIVVELCLVVHFGYLLDETIILRARHEMADRKARRKANEDGCECARFRDPVTESDIRYYQDGPKEVDPRTSKSVSLLRVMLKTPTTIMSFLPRDTPTELSRIPFYDMDVGQRVYALFYAEWNAWMGPPAGPPVVPISHNDNYDFKEEPALFEDRSCCQHIIPYWNPNIGYSFEEHVQSALRSPCSNWRTNFSWLTWTLTRTQDQDTVMMINSVLAGRFGFKSRSMSRGFVEWQNWHNEWFHETRIQDDGKVAFVTPKKGEPEVCWAEVDTAIAYHYFPLKLDVGIPLPSFEALDEMMAKDFEMDLAMVSPELANGGNRCKNR